MSKTNVGFNGRVYLTAAEHKTYLRRMPVRYVRKKHSSVCDVCGLPSRKNNPLQHSHKIPFNRGVVEFKLTPDFLDSPENIVSAHRSVCNKSAELSDNEIKEFLRRLKFKRK